MKKIINFFILLIGILFFSVGANAAQFDLETCDANCFFKLIDNTAKIEYKVDFGAPEKITVGAGLYTIRIIGEKGIMYQDVIEVKENTNVEYKFGCTGKEKQIVAKLVKL